MPFERGQLYWLPKNGTVVEYVGAAAGGQQNVTNKETGDPLTVKTAELSVLDEAAYRKFMAEYEAKGGVPMSEIWEQPKQVRAGITQSIQTIFPDFTLESEEQFEDWRDAMFHMRQNTPEVTTALKEDNTMTYVIGGLLALFLLTYK